MLLYREIGFGLEEIRDLMAGPAFDRREALVTQRDLLATRVHRLEAMPGVIAKTLAAEGEGIPMPQEEISEVFSDSDPSEYEDEVNERWGETDTYQESARRTSRAPWTPWSITAC